MQKLCILLVMSLLLTLIISSISAVIIDPTVFYKCGLGAGTETFNTTTSRDFSVIALTPTYIVFNRTGFNITTAVNIYIQLQFINISTTAIGTTHSLVRFYANATLPNLVNYNISGFTNNQMYTVMQDGVFLGNYRAGVYGNITFTDITVAKTLFNISNNIVLSPPLIAPSPANASTSVPLTPTCSLLVVDPGATKCTIQFWENTTGAYILRQTNLTNSGSTAVWHYTQAGNYGDKYFWLVVVNNSASPRVFANETYYFTTIASVGNVSTASVLIVYTTKNPNIINLTSMVLVILGITVIISLLIFMAYEYYINKG